MTQDEAMAIRQRAYPALEGADEMREDLARRQRERVPSQQPEPASVPQRARERPVDGWHRQVAAIVDAKLTAFADRIAESTGKAMGQYVGHVANEERDKTRTELKTAIEEVRAELAATEERVRTALSAEIRIAALEARLEAAEQRAGSPVRRIA